MDDEIDAITPIYKISLDDDFLKELGEILRNDSSRKIIKVLIQEELIVNQISNKTGLSVSLVVSWMKKFKKAGLLTVKQRKQKRKYKKDSNYYSINLDIFLPLSKGDSDSKIKQIFKDGVKFFSIMLAGVVTYFTIKPTPDPNEITPEFAKNEMLFSLPYLVVIIGLGIYIMLDKIKKRN